MYKRRSFSVIFAGMMVLSLVIVIALVYAGFTGQLNITGSSVQRSSTWDIHFENLSNITTTGSAKVLSQPTLNGTTTIEDYSVSTTSPGDTISFTFKVVNDGNYNASISSVSVGTPTCTGTDSTSNTNVCSKLTYTLTYENGASVQTGDVLYAKDYVIMKVTLTYADFNDSTLLPTSDVSISGLGITINYQQSGSALVNDNGTVANNKIYHQGEKLTFYNEDYYIIADSGAGQDYVVAIKDLPLTVAEVSQYGGVGTDNNHVNKYTYDAAPGTVYNQQGYGGMAYYTSETCGVINGSNVTSGCKTDYDSSDIKYVVDNWSNNVFVNNELKTVNNYKARLITRSEFMNLPIINDGSGWQNWVGGYANFWWTMTEANSQLTVHYINRGSMNQNEVYKCPVVRPVINVYKSALETNNNGNNNE